MIKILFQGDSVTDAGRDRTDFHGLGNGYPKFAAELIGNDFPDREIEFINRGISGDKAESLKARWQSDCIELMPDVVSILIGVNDTWHFADKGSWMPHEYFESCYRDILEQVKTKTKFADVYIPLDGIFAAASVGIEPTFWANDGVHPTEEGSKLIAFHYAQAIKKIL